MFVIGWNGISSQIPLDTYFLISDEVSWCLQHPVLWSSALGQLAYQSALECVTNITLKQLSATICAGLPRRLVAICLVSSP